MNYLQVPAFLDDVKYMMTKGGAFIQISSPLFQLGVRGDDTKSDAITLELEQFLVDKFDKQLSCYWTRQVKENFEKYCAPWRTRSGGEITTLHEIYVSTEMHLLDLKQHIKEITVVKNFIGRDKKYSIGQINSDKFDAIFNEFLQRLCQCLEISYESIFFEDIDVVKKDKFYVEIDNRSRYKTIPTPAHVLPYSPSFTPCLLSLSSCPLASLNPDVMWMVCSYLTSTSMASLELTCSSIR